MSNSTLSNLALQEKTRREILHKSDLIPPLPDFVVRLLALLNRPETEPQDLERQLQSDQVLVAKMLAMVNSPFYGLNRSVRTIKDAVMVLGFRGVRSLVLATSTARFLQRDYGCYGHDQKGLWAHAACVAAAAKHLARTCKLGPDAAEALFVAGLLHDIGKLLLVPYLNDALRGRTTTATMPTTELEARLIGIDHTEAGSLVAAKWNLSTEIQEVLKAHHDATAMGHPQSIAIVRLADAAAHERGIGYLPGRAPAPVFLPNDLATLGLLPAAWDALRQELRPIMTEAVAALDSFAS
ncbi:MAG TPA: HDOD domain-containing protein [Planctomycetota bacterium]|nr:HDOD domain-containing protein [Planctomycetota bacterium]